MPRFHLTASLLTLCAVAAASSAQCSINYNGAIGLPGLGDGYAAPMMEWNDGTGQALYVGGAFTEIGGAFINVLAKYDVTSDSWNRLGNGISIGSTNGFLTSMVPYDSGTGSRLIVAGRFTSAGGVSGTEAIAAWNGVDWSSLGLNVSAGNAVWDMVVGDLGQGPRLFVAGGFGIPYGGIAQYNGTTWGPVGTGVGVRGSFSPYIGALAIFNDGSGPALYAAGRFDTIDGVAAQLAAKYNGHVWSRIGAGLSRQSDALKYLSCMTVFNNGTTTSLYVGGTQFGMTGRLGSTNVARWSGGTTGTFWTGVGQVLGTGRVTVLRGWDDGSGPRLYFAGAAFPGINNFGRLIGNTWTAVDGSLRDSSVNGAAISGGYPSAYGLGEWNGNLVIGGNFLSIGPETALGIGILERCCPCRADYDQNGGIDGSDIESFFADWSDGTIGADVDCNGGIDGGDVEVFFVGWEAGGC